VPRTRIGFAVLVAVVVSLVAGCSAPDRGSLPPASSSGSATSTTAASQGIAGAHVRVVGLWSGPELDSFVAVKSMWEAETGAVVDWEPSTDLAGSLAEHVAAGDPPDVAILPNLALMDQLAEEGALVPLDSVPDMGAISRDYAPAWLDLGRNDGKLYGIFYKLTSKATVWYNPKAFADAGYAVPATWDEMIELADQIVADGGTTFSIVAAEGPANGWALTDRISEIVLNGCGPDLYDRWIAAEIPWTDACIRRSFERFLGIVSAKGYVLGGSERIVATGDDVGADPLYTDRPTAYLYPFASFTQAFIARNFPDLEPGTDYDVFPFPTIDPDHAGAVTVGADIPVLVRDTPAARSFMAFLAGPRAQEAWIGLGGFTSVNRSLSADAYPDPVARRVAEELGGATIARFSAGDMMAPTLQRAWWDAMLELVQEPKQLDEVLDRLTAVAADAR
jgi:alpha-glucoside transport system substrate-binding protein